MDTWEKWMIAGGILIVLGLLLCQFSGPGDTHNNIQVYYMDSDASIGSGLGLILFIFGVIMFGFGPVVAFNERWKEKNDIQ